MQEEMKALAQKAKINIEDVKKLWNKGKKLAKLKKLKVGGPAYIAFARAFMHQNLPAAPVAPKEVKSNAKPQAAE